MTAELIYAALGAGGAILGFWAHRAFVKKREEARAWDARLMKNIEDVRDLQRQVNAISATVRAFEKVDKEKKRPTSNPPKEREWVDLTDDDIQAILKEWAGNQMTVREMLRKTEAKLKEKNP